jgi:hypothetical protein
MKYCIYAIVNTVNGGVYIGSSRRAENRWQNHRKALRAGKHHSCHLQRAWDKHGEEVFRFEIVEEVCDPDQLLVREQDHLDARRSRFPARLNYNVCWVAGNRTGYKYTAEQRKRLSESHMGIARTEGSKVRQAATWCRRYGKVVRLQGPDGVVHEVANMREFARQRGLCSAILGKVVAGVLRQHKGWTLPGVIIAKREYRLIDPDGNLVVHVGELKAFCVARGLPYKSVHAVCSGQMKVCRGWRRAV